jgi:FkbM family methyltransferase
VFKFHDCPGGKIYLDANESPMMRARTNGNYDKPKHKLLNRLLKPGMTFIDVGACVGDFSLLAAKLVGPTGRVITFEPLPKNCACIRKSIEANGYGDIITLHEMAISNFVGNAALYIGKKSGWNSLNRWVPAPGKGVTDKTVTVRVSTLDSMLKDIVPDMVKVDVETAELEVLRGARRALNKNPRMFLLVDLHADGREQMCVQMVRNMGFTLYNEAMKVWHGVATHIVGAKQWDG